MKDEDTSIPRHRILTAGMAAILLAGMVTHAEAQAGHNMELPAHWKVMDPDTREATARPLVVMRPGWHVFAGPRALLWDPGSFASGTYSVTSEMFLFPTPDLGTPYGVFLGGQQFDGEPSAYIAFQIRNDRRFRVVRHDGVEIHELVPWTDHADIVSLEPTHGSPVENHLAVDVREGVIAFYINDAPVAELPRPGLSTDGAIGLAVGDGLSLHVTTLGIGPNRPAG